ncbi:MAG: phage tail family protein [Oscillospiraceae bacterium]|nr:phage tail family protein [Oscillospiraceae bacterium]
MQKLIYENIRGEQAVFLHAPYVLCSLRGMGLSDVNVTASSGAHQQGESILSLRREKRTVQVTLHVMAGSRQEMYQLRSRLCGILSPSLAFDGQRKGRLIYQNDYGTWWTWAVPEGGLNWGKRVMDVQPSVTVNFVCESPYWFGQTSAAVLTGTNGGLILPMALSFTLGKLSTQVSLMNQGQTDAPVTIRMTGSGETPTLTNLRSGASLRLVQPLPVGDELTLCTEPGRLAAEVTHADGSVENGFGLLDPTASLLAFRLLPGMNQLSYRSQEQTARTVVRVEWNDCYEGV